MLQTPRMPSAPVPSRVAGSTGTAEAEPQSSEGRNTVHPGRAGTRSGIKNALIPLAFSVSRSLRHLEAADNPT